MNLKKPMVNQKAIDEIDEILSCMIIMPDAEQDRGIQNAMRMVAQDGFNMHMFNHDISLFFRPFYRLISKEKEYSSKVLEKVKR